MLCKARMGNSVVLIKKKKNKTPAEENNIMNYGDCIAKMSFNMFPTVSLGNVAQCS